MDILNNILSPFNVNIPISLIETENIIVNIEYYRDFESIFQKSIVVLNYFYINYYNLFIILVSLKELSAELNLVYENEWKDDSFLLNVPIPEILMEIKA
jgi:hypothetical protein